MISYYVLSILSILLYLYSFFPIAKINTSSPSFHNQTNFNLTPLSEPTIDRLVLVVIDALRYDFVNPENMPYLSSLSKNNGCSSLVKVESPTVTLPRIKALTTGSVPQFIDVVLNLVRVDSVEDSFLHGAVKKGKKVVFYGDDTWLKAYSDLFLRSEGTSSFFVNDFSEVDDNVTRNVYNEIALKDWDIMILHYLGLDHIGHIYGPFHSLIQPKLQEMDLIIKTIHRNVNSDGKKVLFAVTGDHGMKDSGGHGGTTYSETHVPLVLNGIECENDKIDQIDIPVIFSSLLGLEFPKNSIGKLSMNLLKKSLTKEKLLLFYYYNVLNLQNDNNLCPKFNKSIKYHQDFLKSNSNSSFIKSLKLYKSCLSDLNQKLIRKSIEQYDSGLIISCSALLFCFTSCFLYTFTQSTYKIKFKDSAVIYFVVMLTFLLQLNQFLSSLLCFLIISTVIYQIIIGSKYLKLNIKTIVMIIFSLNIVHGVSMASSSFIEEEHQTWYFYFSSLLLTITIKSIFFDNKSSKYMFMTNVLMLIIFRVMRKLNQTGDKWSHLPDLGQFFKNNYDYLRLYYVISLLLIFYCCKKIQKSKHYFTFLILTLIFVLKFYLNNPDLGKLIWFLIILNLIQSTTTKNCIENLITTFMLISTLLLRPHNIVLPPMLIFLSTIISKQLLSKETFIIAHLWLGTAMYFVQGHSNSLASIDIASGFVSLNDYFPPIVTFQVLCHTYCLPILSHLLVLRKFNDTSTWNLFILQRLWIVTVTFFIAFVLRQHLFIWSVFAPKVLIEASHNIILLIEIFIHHLVLILGSIFIHNKTSLKI